MAEKTKVKGERKHADRSPLSGPRHAALVRDCQSVASVVGALMGMGNPDWQSIARTCKRGYKSAMELSRRPLDTGSNGHVQQ